MSQTQSPTSTRCQRTHKRALQGELPPPKEAKLWVGNGTGMSRCNGCEEIIGRAEREYELLFTGDVAMWFHAECFRTWTELTAANPE